MYHMKSREYFINKIVSPRDEQPLYSAETFSLIWPTNIEARMAILKGFIQARAPAAAQRARPLIFLDAASPCIYAPCEGDGAWCIVCLTQAR